MWEAKTTYLCIACDHVARCQGTTYCPFCREPMINMGRKFHCGPKGNRFKHYPEGYFLTTLVHDSSHYMGFYYKLRVLGGRGYQLGDRDRPMFVPAGTKLRRKGGRIISTRNVS